MSNPILRDAVEYHRERRTMNNPKGWKHVERTVRSAMRRGHWSAVPDTDKERALKVLARMAANDDE